MLYPALEVARGCILVAFYTEPRDGMYMSCLTARGAPRRWIPVKVPIPMRTKKSHTGTGTHISNQL